MPEIKTGCANMNATLHNMPMDAENPFSVPKATLDDADKVRVWMWAPADVGGERNPEQDQVRRQRVA